MLVMFFIVRQSAQACRWLSQLFHGTLHTLWSKAGCNICRSILLLHSVCCNCTWWHAGFLVALVVVSSELASLSLQKPPSPISWIQIVSLPLLNLEVGNYLRLRNNVNSSFFLDAWVNEGFDFTRHDVIQNFEFFFYSLIVLQQLKLLLIISAVVTF